jgi:NADH-quinone oxidoreductase subunit M
MLFMVILLASIGLPLMNGFVGEFTILTGVFQANWRWAAWSSTGVILGAAYMLWLYQRVFFGKVTHPENESLPDLSVRERIALWPVMVIALAMGVAPLLWLNAIDPAVQATLAPIAQLASKVVGQ